MSPGHKRAYEKGPALGPVFFAGAALRPCLARKFPACRRAPRRGQDARPTNLRNSQTKMANRTFPSGRRAGSRPRRAASPANSPPAAAPPGAVKTRALQICGICKQKWQTAHFRQAVGRGLDPAARFGLARNFPACRRAPRRGQDARPTNLRNLQTKMANRTFPSGRRAGSRPRRAALPCPRPAGPPVARPPAAWYNRGIFWWEGVRTPWRTQKPSAAARAAWPIP